MDIVGRATDYLCRKIKFIEIFTMKVSIFTWIALMGLYPQIGATSVYVPTSLVGTVNFYVHPGTLYLTSTKELDPTVSHQVTTGNIAEKLLCILGSGLIKFSN